MALSGKLQTRNNPEYNSKGFMEIFTCYSMLESNFSGPHISHRATFSDLELC
jgi:hypothetical protein